MARQNWTAAELTERAAQQTAAIDAGEIKRPGGKITQEDAEELLDAATNAFVTSAVRSM